MVYIDGKKTHNFVQMDGQMNGWDDGWADGWMNAWTRAHSYANPRKVGRTEILFWIYTFNIQDEIPPVYNSFLFFGTIVAAFRR